MSGFLRPAALATLTRWRGPLIAGGAAALGLWAGLAAGGILAALGWVMAAAGLAALWAAVQRARFAPAAEGPGVVSITEGQIAYFGPAGGGFAAIDEVTEILLARRGAQAAWVLRSTGRPDLLIPADADGADALFDAFAALPGLTGAALIAARAAPPPAGTDLPVIHTARPALTRVWRRPPRALGPRPGG